MQSKKHPSNSQTSVTLQTCSPHAKHQLEGIATVKVTRIILLGCALRRAVKEVAVLLRQRPHAAAAVPALPPPPAALGRLGPKQGLLQQQGLAEVSMLREIACRSNLAAQLRAPAGRSGRDLLVQHRADALEPHARLQLHGLVRRLESGRGGSRSAPGSDQRRGGHQPTGRSGCGSRCLRRL